MNATEMTMMFFMSENLSPLPTSAEVDAASWLVPISTTQLFT